MRSLSEAYLGSKTRYAHCSNCHETFIDDYQAWGSVFCPNDECKGWVIWRSLDGKNLNCKPCENIVR